MTIERRSEGGAGLTGRTVLVAFLAFFGTVAAVNAVMVDAALSTFGGVDTRNAYQAGVAFNREFAAAREQNALGWTVSAHLTQPDSGAFSVAVAIRDRGGRIPDGLHVSAHLMHPADARRDRDFELDRKADQFVSTRAVVEPGQWDLVIEAFHDDERLFRSKNRVHLD